MKESEVECKSLFAEIDLDGKGRVPLEKLVSLLTENGDKLPKAQVCLYHN